MNMDSLNKWLMLAANIGVIAGIIFLGLEIQQNSEAMAASSRQDLLEADLGVIDNLIEYPQLYDPSNAKNLSGDDLPRQQAFFVMMLRIREYAWREFNNGLLDENTLAAYMEPIRFVFNSDQGRAFLLERNFSGDPEFNNYVIDYMGLNSASY